jgi:hypothetical protein
MGRHTRMEAVITTVSNARRHTIINNKEIYPSSEKNHLLKLCSNEKNVMALRR